jgi:hypothetical protein
MGIAPVEDTVSVLEDESASEEQLFLAISDTAVQGG